MIDLHTHSTYSDGTVSPAELLRLAEKAGLSAVALCDHNTISGLPEFLEAARGRQVEAVPGVEFSTDYGDTEIHVLGLFVRPTHYDEVTALVEGMLRRKEESNLKLIRGLNAHGFSLDYDAIKAGTPDGLVNRAVIAAEMVRSGAVNSVKEAFSRWLSPERGLFCPPKRLDVFETIGFIKSIGAVAVVAHPFLNLSEGELRVFLKEAVDAGLDGMETQYSKYDRETARLAAEMAREFSLLESGGSDFHGANKLDILVGAGRGDLAVPEEFLERLRIRCGQ